MTVSCHRASEKFRMRFPDFPPFFRNRKRKRKFYFLISETETESETVQNPGNFRVSETETEFRTSLVRTAIEDRHRSYQVVSMARHAY
uniref:Uncharacterized protein n=1 Tax=Steinernema glaseri TaxID=37863 RepID=A0A1I7YKT4_9BILA